MKEPIHTRLHLDAMDKYYDTGDKRNLPSWHDLKNLDSLHTLLSDEELSEWSSEFPVVESWDRVQEARKQGEQAALIRLGLLPKRKRGRPPGKMPAAKRLMRWGGTHRAASMLPIADRILRDLYADRPPLRGMSVKTQNAHIRERALDVVAYLWLVWEPELKRGHGLLSESDIKPIRWERHRELKRRLLVYSMRAKKARQRLPTMTADDEK